MKITVEKRSLDLVQKRVSILRLKYTFCKVLILCCFIVIGLLFVLLHQAYAKISNAPVIMGEAEIVKVKDNVYKLAEAAPPELPNLPELPVLE